MKKLFYLLMLVFVVSSCGVLKQIEATAPKYFDFEYQGHSLQARCDDGRLRFIINQEKEGVWLELGKGKNKGYYVAAPFQAGTATSQEDSKPAEGRIFVPGKSFELHLVEKN